MKIELHTKILVTAIAFSFLGMAFSGLSGLAINNQEDLNLNNRNNIVSVDVPRMLDISKINERPALEASQGNELVLLNAEPGNELNSIPFNDGFETYTPQLPPDTPPWYSLAEVDNDGLWEERFETSTLNENPDPAVWSTSDGGASTVYWSHDMEDTGIGQNLADAYWVGLTGSYYPGPGAGGTLLGATPPAGAPSGTVWPGITTDTMAAEYTGGGALEYFGPADVSDPDADHVVATAWFYQTTLNQFSFIGYDGASGYGAEVMFMGGDIQHRPGGTQTAIAGATYGINEWHELGIEWDDATETYSVWYDGVEYAAGSAYITAGANINDVIFLTGGTADAFVDNAYVGIPSSGTSEDIYVTDTWSDNTYDSGVQSLYMDQNNEANMAYTQATFPKMYGDDIWMWFVVKTDTVANTNGATFYGIDWMGSNILGIRFDSGNIQYYTSGTWTTLTTYAADTEIMIEIGFNDLIGQYSEIYVNSVPMSIGGAPLGAEGSGLSAFRMQGTPGTQSTIWVDYIGVWTVKADSLIEVDDTIAHTGTQSVHVFERGGDGPAKLNTTLYDGIGIGYGELSIWFYTGAIQGGMSIEFYDSLGTINTVIGLGANLGGGANPGFIEWVDGAGYLQAGPAITPLTWHNISILYDIAAQTYEVRLDGVVEATYPFFNTAADMVFVDLVGGAPDTPADFYFDDISLWIDDAPANPTNLRVAMPEPIPSIQNNYTVDQDNAVEGTVTGTFANVDEILPLDGTTQDIQEATAGGGSGSTIYNFVGVTQATNDNYLYYRDMDDNSQAELTTPNVRTEASDAQYVLYSTSNDQRWISADPGNNDEVGWEFIYTIAEEPASITSIDLTFEGQWNLANSIVTCYAWNQITANWDTIGTTMTFVTADTDYTMTRSITVNPANYVNGGQVRTVFYGSQSSELSRGDFAQCVVNYANPSYNSLEHRWRTENVPAGADNLELRVTAATSAGSDDTFSFGYATAVGGPYTPLITVNSATMATYNAALPALSGQFYINVIDNNNADAAQADTILVDAITIYWQDVLGGGSLVNEVATTDNAVSGTVTGTYALTTSIPEDASAQQIAEVAGGGPATLINEGFEGGVVPPAGWTSNDFDGDGYNWGLADSTAGRQAHTGTYGAYSASYDNTVGALNPDNYLITPQIDLSAYTIATLTWWDASQDPAWPSEYYEVRVSTTGNAPADFTNMVYSGTLVDNTWRQRSVDLSAYTGGSIYITWFHTASSDWYEMDIDDIVLTADSTGNYLEHRWTMENLPMNALSHSLNVYGWTSGGADDGFNVGWSQNLGGPYTTILNINSATPQLYSGVIPAVTSGPLYINVKDDNGADAGIDSVFIDMLYVESSVSSSNTTLNLQWDLSTDDGTGANDVAFYNIYYSDAELGGTFEGPYNYLDSVAAGTDAYAHIGEEADLVNNIWYAVFAEDVRGTESFDFAGFASKFNVAPEAQNVLVDGAIEALVAPGTMVNLGANIYDDTSTWENIPKIDSAEWYDAFVGDPGEGLGTAMTFDGTWDSTIETFTAAIDTSSWGPLENHEIFVRGHEAAPGNTGTGWGIPVSVWINTTAGAAQYDIPIPAGAGAGDWVFVSFPYVMSGNIELVLADASGGGTTWDIAKWYDASTQSWKTYSTLGAGMTDLVTINQNMGVWLRLTASDGILTTSTTGDYSATPVVINLVTGWNLVGFPSATPQTAAVALAGTSATWVATYQATAPFIVDTSNLAGVTMTEGEAYWVYVTADSIWNVPV